MRDRITRATRNLKLAVPVLLTAAMLSLGADSGAAARHDLHPGSRPTLRLTIRPRAVTVAPGQTVRVRILIHRHRLRRAVRFRLLTGLPDGVSARFTRRRTRWRRTTLVIAAGADALSGRYALRIRGRSAHSHRTVTLTLTVGKSSSGVLGGGPTPPFSIAGSAAAPLMPGANGLLNLVITNPSPLPLEVASLSVTLTGVTAPKATAALPCGASDFSVVQYAGPPLAIPGASTRSLSELGVPAGEWPQVSLIDRPTDQDGCQGATLQLRYSADARLG